MKKLLLLFLAVLSAFTQAQTPDLGGVQPNEPFPYTYNLVQGAQRWRDALGRIADPNAGGARSQYGVDVVVLGDSTGTYGDIFSSWPHLLKVRLQNRYNREGVTGGYGFYPFETVVGETSPWTFVNDTEVWVKTHNITGASDAATALFRAYFPNVAATRRAKIWRWFDPTTSYGKFCRQGITDWQYVGLAYSTNTDKVYCDSSLANGVIAPSNLVTAPGGTGQWGYHYAVQTGLDGTVGHTIQICSNATPLRAHGVILYNGDYYEGIRLHNLSSIGSNIYNWMGDGDSTNQDLQLQANIDMFSTGEQGGSKNAKLFLINSMLNDRGPSAGATMTVAQYKSRMQTVISRIIGRPTNPCVGLIINPPWSSGVANAAALADYPAYRDVCYALANANPKTVFVIDRWKMLTDANNPFGYAPHGGNSAGGAMYDRGWYNDGTHNSAGGNLTEALQIYAALTWSR